MGPGHRHFNGGRKTWFKGAILVGTTFKAALNSSAKSATMFCVTIQCFAETKHSTKGYDAECLTVIGCSDQGGEIYGYLRERGFTK